MHTNLRLSKIIVAAAVMVFLAGCQAQPKPAAKTSPAPEPTPVAQPETSRVTLPSDALFAFGKGDLAQHDDDQSNALDKLVRSLRGVQRLDAVELVGYTDRVGSKSYNDKLAQKRADTVREYLIAQGVPEGVITAEGRGEADPIAECPNLRGQKLIDCLAPNRRVEVTVTAIN